MGGAERIIFAFSALGETGKTAALAEGADAVAPSGEDLVGVGLVADVPDQSVGRGVEDRMQGYRELDHTQAGAEMAAGLGHGVDGLPAQLVGKLLELLGREVLQIMRDADMVEQRRLRDFRQNSLRSGASGSHPAALGSLPSEAYTSSAPPGNSAAGRDSLPGAVFPAIAAMASAGLVARVTRSSGPQQIR